MPGILHYNAKKISNTISRQVLSAFEEILQATAKASTTREEEKAPQKLDRWNCSAFIFLRQIQVVDENDAFFAHRRTIHSLPPSVQLGHDHVLGVVHVRPRREVDDVVDELLGGETSDEAAGEEGLSGAGGTNL